MIYLDFYGLWLVHHVQNLPDLIGPLDNQR